MKKELLEKMDMPKKKKAAMDEMALDEELGAVEGEDELMAEEEGMEEGEDMGMEEGMEMEAGSMLADVSDQDLLDEVKRRGLKV